MLKYFKQKGQKLTAHYNDSNKRSSVDNYVEANEDDDVDGDEYDELDSGPVGDIFMCHSRLSMSLQAIVSNLNCLSYFVQYLERRHALPLIKFYLDTENFKGAALTQLEHERRQTLLQQSNGTTTITTTSACEEAVTTPDDNDDDLNEEEANARDERHNSVPELKTLCESQMCKPLTDDEKSQICAANSKQYQHHQTSTTVTVRTHKLSSRLRSTGSELSLCSAGTTNTAWTAGELDASYGGSGVGMLPVSSASVRDAMSIYQKYLRNDAKYFVTLPVGILSEISLLLCKRSDEPHTATADDNVSTTTDDCDEPTEPLVSAGCFDEAQAFVLQQLERDHLHEFLQSSFYSKYCIELIESNATGSRTCATPGATKEDALNICDVLHSEVTLFFFMEYLEQRGERRECLDFWTAAINFRKSCMQQRQQQQQQQAATEMQADAMIIYDKYFSLQSTARLRLLDKLRSHVEERICDEGDGDGVTHCFDLPLQVVVRHLQRRHFADFLKSQLFQNYINELKSKGGGGHDDEQRPMALAITSATVAHPSTIGVRRKLSLRRCHSNSATQRTLRHRKTLSECGTATNTLLASMDNSVRQIQTAAGNTNLNIDARQLTNPNLLWRRSSTGTGGGLQFGYVNALGRYERDFPTVDAFANGAHHHHHHHHSGDGKHSAVSGTTSWSLKNAMRKLVHLPAEDKLQEEIAWQMAEMIVRDVTNVTLRNGNAGTSTTNNQQQQSTHTP